MRCLSDLLPRPRGRRGAGGGPCHLLALAGLTCLCHLGCYAPPGSFEPYPPYGQTYIPPPPTGSIGTPPGYYPPGTYYPGYSPYGQPYPPQQPLQQVPPMSSAPTNTPQASLTPADGNWQSARGAGTDFSFATPQPRFAENGIRPVGFESSATRSTSPGSRGGTLVWTAPQDQRVAQATWNDPRIPQGTGIPQGNSGAAAYSGGYYSDGSELGPGVAAGAGPFVYSGDAGAGYAYGSNPPAFASPIRPSIVR